MKQFFLISIVAVLLTGCATNAYNRVAMPKEEWLQLDKEAQKQLLVQNRKFVQYQTSRLYQEANNEQNGAPLQITLAPGTALFPPFLSQSPFKRVNFRLMPNSCRGVTLQEQNDPKLQTELHACYEKNVVYLDPSHTDSANPRGTIRFYESPIWQRGFTYQPVNTSGHVQLTDAKLTVRKSKE